MDILDEVLYNAYKWGLIHPKEVPCPIKEEKLRAFIIVDDSELNGLDIPDEVIQEASDRLQEGIQKEIDDLFASLREQRLKILIENECQEIRDHWWQDFNEKSLEALVEKKIGRVVYSSDKVSTRLQDKL